MQYLFSQICSCIAILAEVNLITLFPICLCKGSCHEHREYQCGVSEDLSDVKVSLGNVKVKLHLFTFTASASARILPQETASSGRAPESEPSNS